MRKHLNEEHQVLWDRHFRKALAGTGDARQSEAIANEKTLYDVMKASAAIAHQRMLNAGSVTRDKAPWQD